MNIVLLGNGGLAPALRKRGHAVFTVGSMGTGYDGLLTHPHTLDAFLRLLDRAGFTPEALVFADEGCLPVVFGLEQLPFPLVFYSIDTFCNPWHIPYAHAFDAILVAQKDFLPLFTQEGHDAAWFPLFARRDWEEGAEETPEQWLEARDIPVAFVGTLRPKNIPDRLPFLQAFRRLHPLFFTQGNYVPIFRRARIVLNQSAVSEVNFRCFESMTCGAALLADCVEHGFTELFAPGVNVLPLYPRCNAPAAVAVARHWLERPRRLAELALAGTRLVQEKHSDTARADSLIRLLYRLAEERAPARRLAERERHKPFLGAAFGGIAAELGPELADLKRLYYNLCQAYWQSKPEPK